MSEDRAAQYIQNRFKCMQAKKKAKARKADANLRNSNATNLLAQTQGVALLEKVLTRHRASNAVMWENYEIVCLAYEVRQSEAKRARTLFALPTGFQPADHPLALPISEGPARSNRVARRSSI